MSIALKLHISKLCRHLSWRLDVPERVLLEPLSMEIIQQTRIWYTPLSIDQESSNVLVLTFLLSSSILVANLNGYEVLFVIILNTLANSNLLVDRCFGPPKAVSADLRLTSELPRDGCKVRRSCLFTNIRFRLRLLLYKCQSRHTHTPWMPIEQVGKQVGSDGREESQQQNRQEQRRWERL
jgi:hypothetical protein